MKRFSLTFLCALLVGLLSALTFSSCDKDTDCGVDVTVLKKGTNEPLQDIEVYIGHTGGTISAAGITDANGAFSASFHAPAIFDITAKKLEYRTVTQTRYNNETMLYEEYTEDVIIGQRTASTSVRLKDGETQNVTLYLDFNKLEEYTE